MKTHKLKCWPSYFEAIKSGTKTFEIRRNDRDFAVGDRLILQEFDPYRAEQMGAPSGYTDRQVTRVVTYIAQGVFGLPSEMCVMSLVKP